jgi:hypothetical protein
MCFSLPSDKCNQPVAWSAQLPCDKRFQVRIPPVVDVMITIFCKFRQFSAKKIGVSIKNQCYDKFFAKTSSSLSQKRHFWPHFL